LEVDALELTEGFLLGALNLEVADFDSKLQDCLMDAMIVLLDAVSGIEDLITMHNEKGVEMFFWQLGAAIVEIKEVLKDCDPFTQIYENKKSEDDFLTFESTHALNNLDMMSIILKNPKELSSTDDTLEINGNNIYSDLSSAIEEYKEQRWGNAGFYIGQATQSILGGEQSYEQITGMFF
jgi:hypothetical protein